MRSALAIFLFILFPLIALSQQDLKGISPDVPIEALTMDQWTGNDGLISNNLTSVYQSSGKFIWVTSFNGFLRFDGLNFQLFDKTVLPFLNSNGFYKSFEDSKGNLWFTSQSSGIIRYDGRGFRKILAEGKNSLSVRCIDEGPDGRLWVGTNNEGVYVLNDTILQKVNHAEFDAVNIMDIEKDRHGRMWFATNGKGIVIYDNGKVTSIKREEGLNHNTVNKLLLGKDNTMYAGTMDGLYFIKGSTSGRIRRLDGLEINDLLTDDFDNLWLATEQGLYRYNLVSEKTDSITREQGLPASQVSGLCFDHENSLWLSTKKAGLVRFRHGFFVNVTTEQGLSSDNVNIIVEHDGNFYVGCDDGGISIISPEGIRPFHIKTANFNLGIRDINFGPDGEMLVASYRGLLKIKNGREQLIDMTKYGGTNDIRRILRAGDGTIWMATRSGGVIKYVDENNISILNSANGLKSNFILALEEDKDGRIYVGTHSGGLSVIEKDGKIRNCKIEQGKSGILIFNIDLHDDGTSWVATNIGVYRFNGIDEDFTKINFQKTLDIETIFDVVVVHGSAWMSSNVGLLKVEIKDLNDFIDGKIKEVPGRLLDKYDGMANHECTGATRMTVSSRGDIYIPTLGGVAILSPQNVTINTHIPPVYITEFKTDFVERDIVPGQGIVIEPGVLRYEFNYTALSFIAPPKVRFKYKLSGVDKDWVDAGTQRSAIYTNLPKGKHTFRVIACNNDGLWNESGASFSFKVKPYIYETVWFYIIIGAIVFLLVYLRIHHVESINTKLTKLNQELDRFVYSASHDLRAPLSSVLGLVELARLEKTPEKKDECLRMIDSSIKKLDGFINDIIDFSRNQRIELKPTKIDIKDEIEDVLNDLKYIVNDAGIQREIVSSDNDRLFITDARRLRVILKNLLSNAIRYHDPDKKERFIRIAISYESNKAVISVSDNGIGIEKNHLKNIFMMFYRADESSKGSGLGLYIVKETVDKLKGEIKVESKPGVGTTFTIILPELEY